MHHVYTHAPVAGWSGYLETDNWTLFYAADGSTCLHHN